MKHSKDFLKKQTKAHTGRLTQNYNSSGSLTNTCDFTDGGGKELFRRVQYQP